MKKQKFSLNLSLALIIIASLINTTAMRANAGPEGIPGTTSDSTSFGADNFSPGNQTTTTEAAAGVDSVEINNREITVSRRIQAILNRIATAIVNQAAIDEAIGSASGENVSSADGDVDKATGTSNGGENIDIDNTVNSPDVIILAIITRGINGNTLISEVEIKITSLGVNQAKVRRLIKALSGLFNLISAKESNIPVATKSQPKQLVVSNKNLVKDSLLAQNNQVNVDINKLNAAINAYNDIIMESDVKTLKKIAENPELMEIRKILNQLRAALKS